MMEFFTVREIYPTDFFVFSTAFQAISSSVECGPLPFTLFDLTQIQMPYKSKDPKENHFT